MSQTLATTVAAVTSPMPGSVASVGCEGPGEVGAELGVDLGDLNGDGVDQPQARLQPSAGTSRQLQFGQPAPPGRAEQGGQLGDDAQVGQQRMQLGLDPGAHPDQPSAGADQPAGLAGRRWGDRGLGQQVVRNSWAKVLASTASFLTRAAEIALVANG